MCAKYSVVPAENAPGFFRIQRVGEKEPLAGKFSSENAARVGIRRLEKAERKQRED